MRSDQAMRERAVELFESGMGYKAVSSQLEVNRETVRDWSYKWRALGREGFLSPDCTSGIRYPAQLKQAAVLDRLAGKSVVDVMHKYHIANRHCLKTWVRQYKKMGSDAFSHAGSDPEKDLS